jgi:hypothetical protein
MDDEKVPERSLREELMAAKEEVESREEAPAKIEPEPKTAPVRDETGKFAAAETSDKVKEVKEPVAKEPPLELPAKQPAEVSAAPSFVPAPNSWSNPAKAKWAAVDPDIRAEILKRETDIARGMSKVDEERAFAKEMQRVIAPYEAAIRAAGTTPQQAVQSVMNTAYILQTADAAPKAQAMQQRIAQLEGTTQQQTQLQRQAEEQHVMGLIEAFGRDPKNKYFHAVQADMGQLIGSGYAGTLDEAYEAAIWARPDIRAQQLADQQQEAKAKQEAAAKAQRARIKGSSVRGGPGGSPAATVNPNSSVREDLEAAFAEAQGRI